MFDVAEIDTPDDGTIEHPLVGIEVLPKRGKFTWDSESFAAVKALWLDGLSGTQIAHEIGGGLTANSVVGKMWREGVLAKDRKASPRHTNSTALTRVVKPNPDRRVRFRPERVVVRAVDAPRPPAKPRPRAVGGAMTPAPRSTPKAKPYLPPPEILADGEGVTILELNSRVCHWPYGDPSHGLRYCGKTVERVGLVTYCPGHLRMAYQPKRR